MSHEVANGVRVRVAEVWHIIARVALHAVLDPDLLPGQLPCDGHLLFESDVVLSQTVDEAGVAGEIVVVVAGDERDLHALTGGPELLEQPRVVPDEQVELLHPLSGRELPQPERVPNDDKLDILPSFERLQELDELLLEIEDLQLLVPADVQVANEKVFSSHTIYSFVVLDAHSGHVAAPRRRNSISPPGKPPRRLPIPDSPAHLRLAS